MKKEKEIKQLIKKELNKHHNLIMTQIEEEIKQKYGEPIERDDNNGKPPNDSDFYPDYAGF